MSKNIIIQEGGVNKNLNSIKKILTDEQEGGSCNWIPEDEAQRGTKTVNKNGTYKASDDDLYGYSKFTVKVKGGNGSADSSGKPTTEVEPGGPGSAVIGTDDNDENEKVIGVDEDGNLVETKLPSSIAVTKLPDKTEYNQGDTLNPSGIIVHAYYGDGTDYGTVLNSELSFEPMTIEGTQGNELSDGNGVNVIKMSYTLQDYKTSVAPIHVEQRYIGNAVLGTVNGELYTAWPGNNNQEAGSSTMYLTMYNGGVWGKTTDGTTRRFDNCRYDTEWNAWAEYGSTTDSITPSWSPLTWANYYNQLPVSTSDPRNAGELIGRETITVKWKRPADGKILTTTFAVDMSL